MLELKNIYFIRDNKKILDNINLKIEQNKFIAITGQNGSGKSTLAKIIMGIEKQDKGEIYLDGQEITNKEIYERSNMGISFAFQQPVRFKGITVYDLMNLSAGKKLNKKEVCDVLATVGLCANDYINREINSSLSGGELKRIEIATVVVRNAKLVIFDEPEAGIDLWSFNNLIEVFENIRKIDKRTIIIISHQERILNIADEIILMNNGKIEDMGDKDKILSKVLSESSKKSCHCPLENEKRG